MNQQWAQPAHPAPGEPVVISWVWPKGIVGLSVINFLLFIVTLGIYQFWGKTEVRKRIWSAIRIQGEPLAYTGTGLELFLGFLIVFFAVILPLTLTYYAALFLLGPESPWLVLVAMAIYFVIFLLVGVGTYRAIRYRLSRTRWRGIRGGLVGSPWRYAWVFVGSTLLGFMTLFWSMPWQYTILQRRLINDMRFGDRPLSFNAQPGPLYGPFALAWLGGLLLYIGLIVAVVAVMLPSFHAGGRPEDFSLSAMQWVAFGAIFIVAVVLFSLVTSWFSARMMNHFAAHTHFEGATFRASATAMSLFGLHMSNLLLTIFSLGLLSPVAQARSAAYFIKRLALDGRVPLDAIGQGAPTGGRYGEGIAQVFDIDAF